MYDRRSELEKAAERNVAQEATMNTRPATPPDVRMSAQTPQTDAIVSGLQAMLMRDNHETPLHQRFSQAQATLVQHARDLEADRDHYKALCEELRGFLGRAIELADAWYDNDQGGECPGLDLARAALKKAQKDI